MGRFTTGPADCTPLSRHAMNPDDLHAQDRSDPVRSRVAVLEGASLPIG
jgi:hypothetical protein